MRYSIKVFFLLVFFLLYNSLAYSKNNIVFLDIQNAIYNSKIGKKVLNDLKKINLDENSKIEAAEVLLNKENNEIKNLKNIASNEEVQKRIKQFQKKNNSTQY